MYHHVPVTTSFLESQTSKKQWYLCIRVLSQCLTHVRLDGLKYTCLPTSHSPNIHPKLSLERLPPGNRSDLQTASWAMASLSWARSLGSNALQWLGGNDLERLGYEDVPYRCQLREMGSRLALLGVSQPSNNLIDCHV